MLDNLSETVSASAGVHQPEITACASCGMLYLYPIVFLATGVPKLLLFLKA